MSRLPKSIIRFSSGSRPLEMLICGGKEPSDYPWTSRFIGDWPLPVWQRRQVWTVEQKTAFIESVFMVYDLGSVMINELDWPDGQKADFEEIKNYLKHLRTVRKRT